MRCLYTPENHNFCISGWPFAVLLGVPIAFDMLIMKRKLMEFAQWSLISALTILGPMILLDSSYYGQLVVAPLNIVKYNVFSQHGSELYGTEPLSYYLINGFLNFNITWVSLDLLHFKFGLTFE